MSATVPIRVTLLNDDAGWWQCNVHGFGQSVQANRKHGSWMAGPFELRPDVAAEVQRRVRKIERSRRRAA